MEWFRSLFKLGNRQDLVGTNVSMETKHQHVASHSSNDDPHGSALNIKNSTEQIFPREDKSPKKMKIFVQVCDDEERDKWFSKILVKYSIGGISRPFLSVKLYLVFIWL